MRSGRNARGIVWRSVACVEGYKSALMSLSTPENPLNETIEAHLDTAIKGYKKVIAKERKNGTYKVFEGKKHLSQPGQNFVPVPTSC